MQSQGLVHHFSNVKDPRVDRTKKHKLLDILIITVCGFLSGADNWIEIVQWAKMREEWLKRFLEIPNGIPSHDTFGRVFALIEPKEFERAFQTWLEEYRRNFQEKRIERDFVSIDGKKLCGTTSHLNPHTSAIGMVSAWSSEVGIVLGQKKYDFRDDHEKYVMRDMIDLLHLRGCVVSLDAGGASRDIFNKILEKEADFVIGLKANQKGLSKIGNEIYAESNILKQKKMSRVIQEEKGHGRLEKRTYELISLDEANFWKSKSRMQTLRKFSQIKSIGRVVREIKRDGKETHEVHYYLTNLKQDNFNDFVYSIRSHWGIENKLHWVLDVAFNEDQSTVRMKNAAQNVAVIRRLSINLLRQDQVTKIGVKAKRKKAGWDTAYLEKLLTT